MKINELNRQLPLLRTEAGATKYAAEKLQGVYKNKMRLMSHANLGQILVGSFLPSFSWYH